MFTVLSYIEKPENMNLTNAKGMYISRRTILNNMQQRTALNDNVDKHKWYTDQRTP